MTKRLFVGGLPFSVTSEELKEMFSKHGAVTSANVITDKFSGRSKGFGFVEMQDDKEADAAILALHDTEVGGRKIAVNVARPMEERPRFDDRRSGNNNSRNFSRQGGGGGRSNRY